METRRGRLGRAFQSSGRRARLLTVWAMTMAMLLAWLGAAPAAQAADSGFVVIQNQATSDFPKDVAFSLLAQSPDPVDLARFVYTLADSPITYSDIVPIAPAIRVSPSFTLDLQQRYLPPGVMIHYHWILDGQSGGTYSTPWANVMVQDARFPWQSMTKGPLTLYWYDGDTAFASTVLSDATKAYLRAASEVGVQTVPTGQIYLYSTLSDFRGALAQGADQWVGGQTFPQYHVIVLLGPSAQVTQVDRDVSHEVTHLAVDGATTELAPLPTWLDEGMAIVSEGSVDQTYQTALDNAAKSGALLSVQSLSGNFPEDPNQALVAYAESGSLVRYFVQTYGQERLSQLVDAFRHGQTLDQAFENSAGVSAQQFEQGWRASISAKPAGSDWVSVLSGPINFLSAFLRGLISDLSAGKTAAATP